jgi:hypothetical protein
MSRKRNRQTKPDENSNATWKNKNTRGKNLMVPQINKHRIYFNHYYTWLQQIAYQLFEWEGLPDDVPPLMIEMMLHEMGTVGFSRKVDKNGIATHAVVSGIGEMVGTYNVPTSFRSTDRFFSDISFPVYYYGRYKFPNSGLLIKNRIGYFNSVYDLSSLTGFAMYAEKLAFLKVVSDINLNAQKTPIVVTTDEVNMLEMQRLYDSYDGNMPVFYTRDVVDENGNKLKGDQLHERVNVLKTDSPYLLDKISMQEEREWNNAMTWLSLDSISTNKKERLVTSEADANKQQSTAMQNSMLKAREEFCILANQLWDWNISVRPTQKIFYDEMGNGYGNSNEDNINNS